MNKSIKTLFILPLILLFSFNCVNPVEVREAKSEKILSSDDYEKSEYMIPMRDGVKLFTSVYVPKKKSDEYPILLNRTPYSVRPYGDAKKRSLHPSNLFVDEKFIFVFQDVRGTFMSEGTFVNMRPQLTEYNSEKDIDESTDTYDTVDWLIKNIKGNNGKVGLWGISYPGFYAAAATINSHPAVKAISPQAPIADWFFDDFHHHGTLFLPHSFGFLSIFGQARPEPTKNWGKRFQYPTPDGYDFYLNNIGPLENVNKNYFKGDIDFWNQIVEHPNYDDFWQRRNLLPHLKGVTPAVLVVGGWFDAEDLYGPLNIYENIEKNNPRTENFIVMGPWSHGAWAREGDHLGNVLFSQDPDPSLYYRENLEFPFFMHYLKDIEDPDLAEATMFVTGENMWREFETWPPKNLKPGKIYLNGDGTLGLQPENGTQGYREFISNPAKPVPFTETVTTRMSREYMTDDQRFASRRPDVLTYQSGILDQDLTIAGKMIANLFVSISQTDADWIVKLIDVYPDDAPDNEYTADHIRMAGYQQLVRSEAFRGRFRNSYEFPEPFVPNEITQVKVPLQDILHTFKKGHRIMVQVQSTWFPLVDRNPQKYVPNIYEAKKEDFVISTHKIYSSPKSFSNIEISILKD